MSLSSKNWFRGLAATTAAVVFAMAGGAAALADNVQDDVVAGVNSSVAVGSTTTVNFRVSANNGDGVAGCNFNSTGDSMSATLSLSGSGSATPSNATVVFTACDLDVPVVFTGTTAGTVNGELTQLANNTGGTFNFNPAKFTLTVTTPTKAPTTTTVTCPTSRTYTGAALTPCSARVTGSGGFDQVVPVSYTGNTTVGTATATAGYAGDATHLASSGTATFAITKAGSSTTVVCPEGVTWTGAPQTPCTASVTGAGGLNQVLTPTYVGNTAVGTATASASYLGDANHDGSSYASTFQISKAGAAVKVTCSGAPFTYTGSAQKPCTATVTGAGGLNESVDVTYSGNVDAGTATASASFAGDAGHEPASGSTTFDIGQALATCTVTAFSGSYDATAHALTATCTGIAGADLSTGFDPGEAFTDAGDHTAHWTFDGGTNYADQFGTGAVTIAQADSTTVVTCPTAVTYDGSAQEPCTAKVTGVGGLSTSLEPTYSDNVSAGTATASASFGGDGNHLASGDSATFEIGKAASTTTVTCPAGPFVYTGSPITPACTASTTGAGGLTASPSVSFTDNVDAGAATAAAEYAGDPNHFGSTGSKTFTIDKASSTVSLICTSPVTYTGSPLEVCSAAASGAGIVTPVALVVAYTANTDAGTAHASAAWTGDANHEGSSDATTFTILPAPSTTEVTCPASMTFTGSALTPCTATVTGAGGLSQTLTVGYADNVHAGTATASAAYAGDDNHTSSSDTQSFAIDQAPTTTVVSCPDHVTFTGSAQTPCTATATGAGGLSESLGVNHTSNVHAGTATASASYAGDADHTGSSDTETFAIDKAPSTTTVTCPAGPFMFTGSAQTPCTATATGVGGLSQSVVVTYIGNTYPGTASADAAFAGDTDHLGSTGSATFTIASWSLKGFYQPVDMNGVVNTVKAGSTVPLKFELFAGTTELTATSTVKSFTQSKIACDGSSPTDELELTTTGGTSLRYDTTGGQFVQNWQTPKTAGVCYRVTMTTQDLSTISALFKLK